MIFWCKNMLKIGKNKTKKKKATLTLLPELYWL